MRRLLLRVLVRLLHDGPGRAYGAVSVVRRRRGVGEPRTSSTRPVTHRRVTARGSAQVTNTPSPRPARSSTTARRRPASREARRRRAPL
jgi:hypothetical protein